MGLLSYLVKKLHHPTVEDKPSLYDLVPKNRIEELILEYSGPLKLVEYRENLARGEIIRLQIEKEKEKAIQQEVLFHLQNANKPEYSHRGDETD